MFEVSVQTNLREFARGLRDVAQRQMPFAVAMGLNRLAERAIDAEQKNESKVLDRPRPFTQNALRVRKASKGNPTAVVYMMDRTAKYLRPYQFGGRNALNSKVLLKPVQSEKDLDQFGNLPRRYMAQMKGRSDVFVGTVQTKAGPVTGLWQRSTEEKRVKVTRTGKDGAERIHRTAKAINATGQLKLLVKFEDAHEARQYLDWFGVAERVINSNFSADMRWALQRALSTKR